jgi:hypothetical protein
MNKLQSIGSALQEAVDTSGVHTEGNVIVELIDDRTNKVVDRQEAHNYVNTTMLNEWAKSVQKLIWSYGYAGPTPTNNPYTSRDPRWMPTVRNDHIACWADNTAETTADMYAFGEIVAWAHRWQQGSPSTRQGIIVPSLCSLASDSVKWVWEWGTPNGNGTFQSIGWRRLSVSSSSGDARVADYPHLSRRCSTSQPGYTGDPSLANSSLVGMTVGPSVGAVPFYYDSVSGRIYFNTLAPTTSQFKLCSCPISFDASGWFTLGAVTDESASSIAAGLGGDNVATGTRLIIGITRMGPSGDWIGVGHTSSGSGKRPTIRRVTAAGSITYTNANAATYTVESLFSDVTYDGTNLWVAATTSNNGNAAIHRIDPATGTISATISAVVGVPANFPQWGISTGPISVEWDAGLSCLWVTTQGYLMNIDTSGNWMGVLITFVRSEMPPNPGLLSGQFNTFRMNYLNGLETDVVYVQWHPSSNTPVYDTTWPGSQGVGQQYSTGELIAHCNSTISLTSRGRLFTMDGDLWISPPNNAYGAGSPNGLDKMGFASISDRPNFATRSLLTGAVSKNNTQSMRITYTMSFT